MANCTKLKIGDSAALVLASGRRTKVNVTDCVGGTLKVSGLEDVKFKSSNGELLNNRNQSVDRSAIIYGARIEPLK